MRPKESFISTPRAEMMLQSKPQGCSTAAFRRTSRALLMVCGLALWSSGSIAAAQAPLSGPLVVFNAGSLAKAFAELLRAFRTRHPDVVPAQENSGSLEADRKQTNMGKIHD